MSGLKNRSDFIDRAHRNPILHTLYQMWLQGLLSWEQMLLQAACSLADLQDRLMIGLEKDLATNGASEAQATCDHNAGAAIHDRREKCYRCPKCRVYLYGEADAMNIQSPADLEALRKRVAPIHLNFKN